MSSIGILKPPNSKMSSSQFIKYGVLFVITLQTSTMVLLLRYSRKSSISSGHAYLNSTAVFLSEVLKLIACFIFLQLLPAYGGVKHTFKHEIIGKPRETLKIFIPAFLYTVQNNLLFLALSNLDAATYQVTYQFKIITTALFSVILLHKRLGSSQWVSLLTLMGGVTLVQWPTESHPANGEENRFIGFAAVILSSFSSGFSGVYFEKLLKFNSQSLWVRNTQLALISCGLSMFTILSNDYSAIVADGFFQGYDIYTWYVVLLQAFGGICVSLVMKYADNILKGFATTFSIIISSICSYYIFSDFVPSNLFLGGTLLVVFSTILYSV